MMIPKKNSSISYHSSLVFVKGGSLKRAWCDCDEARTFFSLKEVKQDEGAQKKRERPGGATKNEMKAARNSHSER